MCILFKRQQHAIILNLSSVAHLIGQVAISLRQMNVGNMIWKTCHANQLACHANRFSPGQSCVHVVCRSISVTRLSHHTLEVVDPFGVTFIIHDTSDPPTPPQDIAPGG